MQAGSLKQRSSVAPSNRLSFDKNAILYFLLSEETMASAEEVIHVRGPPKASAEDVRHAPSMAQIDDLLKTLLDEDITSK